MSRPLLGLRSCRRSAATGATDTGRGARAFHGLSSPPKGDVESRVVPLRPTNRFLCPVVVRVRTDLIKGERRFGHCVCGVSMGQALQPNAAHTKNKL